MSGDPRNAILAQAWADFIMWAAKQAELRAAFKTDTGRSMNRRGSPLEEMIDAATGKDSDDAMAFAVWVTRTQWGWDDAPASFRADGEAWEREQKRKTEAERKPS